MLKGTDPPRGRRGSSQLIMRNKQSITHICLILSSWEILTVFFLTLFVIAARIASAPVAGTSLPELLIPEKVMQHNRESTGAVGEQLLSHPITGDSQFVEILRFPMKTDMMPGGLKHTG